MSKIIGVGHGPRISPLPPDPGDVGEWRANEPEGFTTLIDSDFDYSGIDWGDDDWFGIEGSVWGGRSSASPDSPSLRSDGNGPVSVPNGIRFDFPEGAADGTAPGGRMFSSGVSATTSGVYYTFAMRLSPNWAQNPTPVTGNTFKHVEFGGNQNSLIIRTGITKIPDDSQDRYRMKLANWANSDLPNHVIDDSTAWFPGDWITVEVRANFNQDSQADSGSMYMWVNGNVAASLENTDIPDTAFSGIQAANVHGGGIGNVPHDQWYEFDHFYLSVE